MRKKPYFGCSSLLVLACTVAPVFLLPMSNSSDSSEPSENSMAILVDSPGHLIYATFIGAIGVWISASLSLVSLFRGESRLPARVGLLICVPLLLYLGVAFIESITKD